MLLGLLALLVLLALLLQLPPIQTALTSRIMKEFSRKSGTVMRIEKVSLRLPSGLSIRGLYLEDQQADTLLYLDRLRVDMRPLALLQQKVIVNRILVDGLSAHVYRHEPDSVFNFQFLLDVFTTGDDMPAEKVFPSDKDGLSMQSSDPSPWQFIPGLISLNDIKLRFADDTQGLDASLYFSMLQTQVLELSPGFDSISTGEISLDGARLSLGVKSTEKDTPDNDPARLPDIMLDISGLNMTDISLWFASDEAMAVQLAFDRLHVVPEALMLSDMAFAFRRIALQQADFLMWDKAGRVPASPQQAPGINPSLEIASLDLRASALWYSEDSLALNLESLSARAPGLLDELQLSARFSGGRQTRIQELLLTTANSRVRGKAELAINLLAFDSENLASTSFDIRLSEVRLGADLLGMVPGIDELLSQQGLQAGIRGKFDIKGTMADFRLQHSSLSMPGVFSLQAGGRVQGLPEADRVFASLPLISLQLNTAAFQETLLTDLFPESQTLPQKLGLEASFYGGMQQIQSLMSLQTDMGLIEAELAYKQAGESLTLQIDVEQLQAGSLAGISELGDSLKAGFTLQAGNFSLARLIKQPDSLLRELHLSYSLALEAFDFMDYPYRNARLSGQLADGRFDVRLSYYDEALQIEAENRLWPFLAEPRLAASWQIAHMDLFTLGFSPDSLFFLRGRAEADMQQAGDDFALGFIDLLQTEVFFQGQLFRLDSLHLETTYLEAEKPFSDSLPGSKTPARYGLDLGSSVFRAGYQGNISPVRVPGLLSKYLIDRLEEETRTDTLSVAMASHEETACHFDFFARAEPSLLFTELLLSELESFQGLDLEGSFDTRSGLLRLHARAPLTRLSGVELAGLRLDVNTDALQASMLLKADFIEAFGLSLHEFELESALQNSRLDFQLNFQDVDNQPWFALGGHLKGAYPDDKEHSAADDHDSGTHGLVSETKRQGWYLHFNPAMMLAAEPWQMNPDNQIWLDGSRINIQDLTMTFRQGRPEESFIQLDLQTPEPGFYQFDARLNAFGHRLDAGGTYRMPDDSLQTEPWLDALLQIEQIDLAALESFTMGELREMEGRLSGRLEIRGNPSAPDMQGLIHFTDASFSPSMTRVRYRMPDESIRFSSGQLRFEEFRLLDPEGRSARLNGLIFMDNLSQPGFDLRLQSGNFLLVDVPSGEIDLFSGRLLIDTDLRLRGNLSRPVIEGSLTLNQGSAFVFNVPATNPSAIGDQGVVEFFSSADTLAWPWVPRREEPDILRSGFQNLEAAINIEVDPSTDVRVNLDPFAGDFLQIKGGGQFSYGTDPGGVISLAGRHELTEGTYLLTFYDVFRRQFSIQRGSHISFSGDPMNPELSITAVYNLRTSVAELFEHAGQGAGASDPAFRQSFPFQVLLKMKGELMEPDISFDIVLPPGQQNALDGRLAARLDELRSNESELNKQVFALLSPLGSFLPENPLAMGGDGAGISAGARASASRLLSQQLNRLSDQYIRGLDIRFDIESIEDARGPGTGGSTQMNLEVSRNFFDERMRITVGGNIELEDDRRRETSAADIAGDFLIEYLLKPDGSLIIKGFRQKEFRDLFEGQVIETGIALLLNRSFNHFRELFTRPEEILPPAPQ